MISGVLALSLLAPAPGILKCSDLRVRLVPPGSLEQQVVIALGIEGRVEIDEIDAVIGDVLAQDFEVVPKE
jgi:hypothetical protein